MKPPEPIKGTFPKSWRRWRKLKAGETLRYTDRVVSVWDVRRGIRKVPTHSHQLGSDHAGERVRPHNQSPYTAGWYYRRLA